jgi:hypothetical protein
MKSVTRVDREDRKEIMAKEERVADDRERKAVRKRVLINKQK